MSFGKRRVPPKKPGEGTDAAARPVQPPSTDETTLGERFAAWQDTMERIFREVSMIAAAVRDEGGIAVRGLDSEVHPDTTPIHIKGMEENFMLLDAGKPAHPVYGYVLPTAPMQVDQSAQLHLHHLMARIMELNVFCQRAEREGAIAVALQAPKLPPIVDRIIVSSAFFSAYFENLALTQPLLLAGEPANSARLDYARFATSYERRRLMCLDRMIAPQSFDDLVPHRKWPHIGVETTTKPHAGQRFINGVYFPVDMAPAPMGPGLRAASVNAV